MPVAWERGRTVELRSMILEKTAAAGATFAGLPPRGGQGRRTTLPGQGLRAWLYASQQARDVLRSPATSLLSEPGESERDFRARLAQGGREARDAALDKLRATYAPKRAALEDRKRRAEQAKEKQADQAKDAALQTAISIGATLLGPWADARSSAARRWAGRRPPPAASAARCASSRTSDAPPTRSSPSTSRWPRWTPSSQAKAAELQAAADAEHRGARDADHQAQEGRHRRAAGGAGLGAATGATRRVC